MKWWVKKITDFCFLINRERRWASCQTAGRLVPQDQSSPVYILASPHWGAGWSHTFTCFCHNEWLRLRHLTKLVLRVHQATQRLLDRTERQKERERRRKEQQEEEEKKREEERKERLKGREKDGGVMASGGVAGRAADGDRERDRGRDREGDKKRDGGHRPRRPSAGAGSGRRSRSRSNPRDRRRWGSSGCRESWREREGDAA